MLARALFLLCLIIAGAAQAQMLWAPPTSPLAVSNLPARTALVQRQTYIGTAGGLTAMSTNSTVANVLHVEAQFDSIRLAFANDSITTPAPIDGVIIAPTSAYNDGVNPLNAAGGAGSWTTVTFNNACADKRPDQQTSGSTTTATIAVTTSATKPTICWSDWMQVSSLARTDGNFGALLMVRIYASGANTRLPFSSGGTSWNAQWASAAGYRSYASFVQFGANGVATPSALNAPLAYSYVAPYSLQYYARARAVNWLAIGDSIVQGTGGSASGSFGWPIRIAYGLSTASLPLELANNGVPSQTSANWTADSIPKLLTGKFGLVTIPVWTPNDSNTQAAADAAIARAFQIAELARQNGAVPVLITAIPYAGINSGAADAYRLGNNAKALAARAAGYLVCDMDAVISDGASPARIKSALDSGDGTHPNDTGYTAMDGACRPVIAAAMALR